MLRRIAPSAASMAAAPVLASSRAYNLFVFKNPERRPQLTAEQRAKVEIDYTQWPAEFRDFDPEDPYKHSPPVVEGLSSWQLFLWGAQVSFIYHFYECVFYKTI